MSSVGTGKCVKDGSDSDSVTRGTASSPMDRRTLKSDTILSTPSVSVDCHSPVERAGGTESICAHLAPTKPVANFQTLR